MLVWRNLGSSQPETLAVLDGYQEFPTEPLHRAVVGQEQAVEAGHGGGQALGVWPVPLDDNGKTCQTFEWYLQEAKSRTKKKQTKKNQNN